MMAIVYMEEGALYWLCWLHHRQPHITWEQLSLELVNHYNADLMMSLFERLVAVKQTDSIDSYIDEFVTRVA